MSGGGAPVYSIRTFSASHAPTIALACACVFAVAGILTIVQATPSTIALVVALLSAGVVSAGAISYSRDMRFWRQVTDFANDPVSARVIAALLDNPTSLEARLAFEALRAQGEAASDEINATHEDERAYRRYIELWVHETKAPIASAQLTLSGMHGGDADDLKNDLLRIELQIEQALYYARATAVAGDYLIAEANLAALVEKACHKHARRLIGAGITPQLEIPPSETVLADEKWLTFILSQIIENSVKYGARTISFTSGNKGGETSCGFTWLRIADDGAGIPAKDVPRVFDRGFTGSAGRTHHPATGMGLYLVKVACENMGLGLELESEEGAGTAIAIRFPHNRQRMLFATAEKPYENESLG